MPKYIVQHTPVLHGAEKDKQATRYEIGEEIELTDKDAQKLGDNVASAKNEVKKPADSADGNPDDKEKAPAGGKPGKNEGNEAEAGKEKEKKKQQ